MKHAKWLLLLVLLASLALSLAACGGSTEPTSPPAVEATQGSEGTEAQPTEEAALEPTPTPEPTEAPTDTPLPEPTDTPETVEEFDLSSLASTTELSSYRSLMRITTVAEINGQEETQTIDFSVAYTSDPLAQHIRMSGEALGAEGETVEMYLIEDTMYMKMGDQWLSLPATEEDIDTDSFITADSLLEDICGWKDEGSEEIDGIKVRHWAFTKEDFDECMLVEDLASMGELTDAGGDLYVAEDGNYVVLMEMFYEGEDLDLDLGEEGDEVKAQRMEIHYETTDVNEPFTIEAPAEALESGALPEDLPMPEDAADVNNMFGMITFTSELGPEAVFAFYQEEMPNNGWTEVSAEASPGFWMMEYSKDGRSANLMITEEDSGNASVMITLAEPE
ncbi:MAG: hypothetical protein PVH95_14115 [Anaerolineae bacterium]|jgi:hypothetical protein